MTAPLSADEQARLERIEAAPEAEEAIRERVARALYDEGAWCGVCDYEGYDACRECRAAVRSYADAALAVLRGPSVADEALRRVEELAEELDAEAARHDDAEPISTDGLTRMILAARHCRDHADRIRAALNGGDR
ncbi:MAG: hypothetical protein ACXVGF_04680 [Blastococcus sp.]